MAARFFYSGDSQSTQKSACVLFFHEPCKQNGLDILHLIEWPLGYAPV